MFSSYAWCYDLEKDGIYYNVLNEADKTVEVTYKDADYPCYSEDVVIPSTVNGYNVISIGDYAFSYCTKLTSITIPGSVTGIGEYAFESCDGLTSVTIPGNVTSIGFKAFYFCSGLKSVIISNGVTSIEDDAFSGCFSLTSVTIPSSLTSLGAGAFHNCDSLPTDEDGCVYLGNIFVSCPKAMKEYTVKAGTQFIHSHAFDGCSDLVTVTIPGSVTNIGVYAFRDCTSLVSVDIPNGVKSIESYAFLGCSELTSVTIPKSVENIGGDAFGDCDKLANVYNYAEEAQSSFEDIFSTYGTLHVLKGYKDVYADAWGWEDFTIVDDLEPQQNNANHIDNTKYDVTEDMSATFSLDGGLISCNNLKTGIYIRNSKKFMVK